LQGAEGSFNAAACFQQEHDFMKHIGILVDNLGDKAYYNASINQVGVLYKNCFFIVAFQGVKEEQNEEICKAVAKKIIEKRD
jgi:hypothetical protein